MILSEFYEKYLKDDDSFELFINKMLTILLPNNFDITQYKEELVNYLFYNDKTFLYTLKYTIFNYVDSQYIHQIMLELKKNSCKFVKVLWRGEESLQIITILENKKLEILETIMMPSFKSLENDLTNGEIIQNILNSILENMQYLQDNQNIMLANISHEMRTPLNSVIGYLDVLEANVKLKGEERKHIHYAKNSAKLLLNLINDLLDTQKLSNAKLDIIANPFWINKVIKNAVLISLVNANQKNVNFIYKDELNIFTELIGDKNRILQILNNLFSNAVKFTPSNGKVEVVAKSRDLGDKVEIEVVVEDTGIGIAKEKQKELFKPFSRATTQEKGTGLGLYISKQLAQKMGGDIWFESEEGKGTTFYFKLLLKKNILVYDKQVLKNRKIAVLQNDKSIYYCQNLKTQIENIGGKIKIFDNKEQFMKFILYNQSIDMSIIVYPNDIEDNDLDKSFISTYKFIKQDNIRHYFIAAIADGNYPNNSEVFDKIINSPLNVLDIIEIFTTPQYIKQEYKYLIIDDEPLNRQVLETLIKTIDKKSIVKTANDGIEGLEKLKKESFDIVFLDKRMPKLDGYGVLEKLKELGIDANIYLLTADGDSETINKAKEYNVGYLAKPVSMSTLESVMANIVKRSDGGV
jgi:signal transduction histidine kinase/ActR/RegA family two-component response regulator